MAKFKSFVIRMYLDNKAAVAGRDENVQHKTSKKIRVRVSYVRIGREEYGLDVGIAV